MNRYGFLLVSFVVVLSLAVYLVSYIHSVDSSTLFENVFEPYKLILPSTSSQLSSSDLSRNCDLAKNAIVYLVQKNHSSYKYDSNKYLIESLNSIFANYLNASLSNSDDRFNVDIYFFHTGDYTASDKHFFVRRYNFSRFHLVNLTGTPYWSLPFWLREDSQRGWVWGGSNGYKIGYRHMIRWYSLGIWHYFDRLKYEYIWRLDDDSSILSPIYYNVFAVMKQSNYNYGFRQRQRAEGGKYDARPFIREYIRNNYATNFGKVKNLSYDRKKAETFYYNYLQNDKVTLALFEEFGKHAFYNNFFIGKVAFFVSEHVYDFLYSASRSGLMYRKRVGDLNFQSAAVVMYSPPEKIYLFHDFTYHHKDNVAWGTNDTHSLQSKRGNQTWGMFMKQQCGTKRKALHIVKLTDIPYYKGDVRTGETQWVGAVDWCSSIVRSFYTNVTAEINERFEN